MKLGSLVKHTTSGDIHRVIEISKSKVKGHPEYAIYSLTPPLNIDPFLTNVTSVYKKYLIPYGFCNYLDKL